MCFEMGVVGKRRGCTIMGECNRVWLGVVGWMRCAEGWCGKDVKRCDRSGTIHHP